MKKADYLIIGGGLVGTFAAYFLNRRGQDVTVVDASNCCNMASMKSAGTCDPVRFGKKLIGIGWEGIQLWKSIQEDLGQDLGYRRIGGIYVAFNEQERNMLAEKKAFLPDYGIPVESTVGTHDIMERYPFLSPSIQEVIYTPMGGYGNPLIAGPTLMRYNQAHGVQFYPFHPVSGIESNKSAGGYDVIAGDEAFHAKKILISTGVWAPEMLKKFFNANLELELHIQQVTATEKAPLVLPYVVSSVGMSLKQNDVGTVVLGGGWQGTGGLDTGISYLNIENLSNNAAVLQKVVPSLGRINILRSWTCFDSYRPDWIPVIEKIAYHEGAYLASAGAVGFSAAPAVALHAVDMMMA